MAVAVAVVVVLNVEVVEVVPVVVVVVVVIDSSFWQNAHKSDSVILTRNNLPLVYTISFSILY